MFTAAFVTGVKNGWLDETRYAPAARKAWIALVGYLEGDGRLRGVSDWMYGGTIAEYTARPTVTGDNHGQAPMLWSAAALLR
jgi:rhamnogalacturonyl hydrolase YesR